MFLPWISGKRYQKTAIVGICKNAGKTTVLNAIMQSHNLAWGLITTGRDGEAEDVIYKTPKPRVQIPRGSLFCVDSACLDALGTSISIREKTIWQSGGKRLWIAKAESDLESEIGGPQNTVAQIAMANRLLHWGAEKVLIDGSLDRKSIALSDSVQAVVLAIGASFGSVETIVQELTRLLSLASLPRFSRATSKVCHTLLNSETIMLKRGAKWQSTGLSSLLGNEKQLEAILGAVKGGENHLSPHEYSHIYLPGAYTISVHNRIGKLLSRLQIVLRHAECLKLQKTELDAYLRDNQPQVLIPFQIKSIALNSYAVGANPIDADFYRQELRKSFPNIVLTDLKEIS